MKACQRSFKVSLKLTQLLAFTVVGLILVSGCISFSKRTGRTRRDLPTKRAPTESATTTSEVQWVKFLTETGQMRALYKHPNPDKKLPVVIYNHGAFVEKFGYDGAAARGYDVKDFVEAIAQDGYVGIAPIRGRKYDENFLDGAMEFLQEQENVDKERVAVVGFSKGGIFTVDKAIENPEWLKGIILLAGGYTKIDQPVSQEELSKLSSISVPVYIALGAQDTTPQLAENTGKMISELEKSGKDVRYKTDYQGDHKWFRQVHNEYWNDVAEFLKNILED